MKKYIIKKAWITTEDGEERELISMDLDEIGCVVNESDIRGGVGKVLDLNTRIQRKFKEISNSTT